MTEPSPAGPSSTGEVADLMGVGEAAALLGVSKQRVHQLARSAEFPQPLVRLAATPVWSGEDLRRYAGARRRIHECPTCQCGPKPGPSRKGSDHA
jgi:hypothetical protein